LKMRVIKMMCVKKYSFNYSEKQNLLWPDRGTAMISFLSAY
jgi:hypothetical protein